MERATKRKPFNRRSLAATSEDDRSTTSRDSRRASINSAGNNSGVSPSSGVSNTAATATLAAAASIATTSSADSGAAMSREDNRSVASANSAPRGAASSSAGSKQRPHPSTAVSSSSQSHTSSGKRGGGAASASQAPDNPKDDFRPGAYEMTGRAFGEVPSWAVNRVTNLARNLSSSFRNRTATTTAVIDAELVSDSDPVVLAELVQRAETQHNVVAPMNTTTDNRKPPPSSSSSLNENNNGTAKEDRMSRSNSHRRGLGLARRLRKGTESLRGKFRKGRSKTSLRNNSSRSLVDDDSVSVASSTIPNSTMGSSQDVMTAPVSVVPNQNNNSSNVTTAVTSTTDTTMANTNIASPTLAAENEQQPFVVESAVQPTQETVPSPPVPPAPSAPATAPLPDPAPPLPGRDPFRNVSLSGNMQRSRACLLDDEEDEEDEEENDPDHGAFIMAAMQQNLPASATTTTNNNNNNLLSSPPPPQSVVPNNNNNNNRVCKDEHVAEVLEVFPDAKTDRVKELLRQHSLTTTMITLAEESNTLTAPSASLLRQVTSRVEQSTKSRQSDTNDTAAGTALHRGTTFANANTYAREIIMQQVLEIFPEANPKEIEGILMEHSTYQSVAILSQKAEQGGGGLERQSSLAISNNNNNNNNNNNTTAAAAATRTTNTTPAAAARLPSELLDESSSMFTDTVPSPTRAVYKTEESDEWSHDRKPSAVTPAFGRKADNSSLLEENDNQERFVQDFQRHLALQKSQNSKNEKSTGRYEGGFYDLGSLG